MTIEPEAMNRGIGNMGRELGRWTRSMRLRPWSTWRHVKTDSLYTVLGVATCSTNGPNEGTERAVIYLSHEKQELHYREVGEFLDGRFQPISHPTHAPTA